ncbi:hypothetical protein V8C42DRAFT_349673 [Trichoderma barbatum]
MQFSIVFMTFIASALAQFGDVPACAVACIEQSVVDVTGCGPTDLACSCAHSAEVGAAAGPCILSSRGCGPNANIAQITAAAAALCDQQ